VLAVPVEPVVPVVPAVPVVPVVPVVPAVQVVPAVPAVQVVPAVPACYRPWHWLRVWPRCCCWLPRLARRYRQSKPA